MFSTLDLNCSKWSWLTNPAKCFDITEFWTTIIMLVSPKVQSAISPTTYSGFICLLCLLYVSICFKHLYYIYIFLWIYLHTTFSDVFPIFWKYSQHSWFATVQIWLSLPISLLSHLSSLENYEGYFWMLTQIVWPASKLKISLMQNWWLCSTYLLNSRL